MQLAARLLFLSRKRVLTTDLEWPAYRAILERESERVGGEVHEIPLRAALVSDRCTATDLVRIVLTAYDVHRCEAVFLSAVSYHGLRLPVRMLAEALGGAPCPPLVVVDGAQTLGHAPPDAPDHCDLYIAGSHKWLRASYPMGVAFCPRRGSQDVIQKTCSEMIESGELDDPLLRFTEQCASGVQEVFGETVSLGALFPCAAAVADLMGEGGAQGRFERFVGRAREMEEITAQTTWKPVVPAECFRSGIVLLQSQRPGVRAAGAEQVRRCFQEQGVALTAYGDGIIRLSAPQQPLGSQDVDRLRSALSHCA